MREFLVALVLFAGLALAGCGSDGNVPPPSAADAAKQEPLPPPPPTPANSNTSGSFKVQ